MLAMYVRMAAALSELSRCLGASPVKEDAPVPAATHHTINGGIQTKVSNRWIQVIPRAQITHTNVHMTITPAHVGNLPSDRAWRTDAPEIELIAFQPVVAIMEKTTTSMLPQYPNEYRLWYNSMLASRQGVKDKKHRVIGTAYEKVVILRPVNPAVAVHAGSRSLVTFTTKMTMKHSQNPSPREPPRDPMFRVATAILALNLWAVYEHKLSPGWYIIEYILSYQKVAAFQNLVG